MGTRDRDGMVVANVYGTAPDVAPIPGRKPTLSLAGLARIALARIDEALVNEFDASQRGHLGPTFNSDQ